MVSDRETRAEWVKAARNALNMAEIAQRRYFTDAEQAKIRGIFEYMGADLGDPRGWSNVAVNLNEIDMSLQGWVPQDMALLINRGEIPWECIPDEFMNTAYDDAYALTRRSFGDQALG